MSIPCDNIMNCPMFRLFEKDEDKRHFIENYCESNFAQCERKQMKDEGFPVPVTMLPDGSMI